jgi:death-on-curing protein
MGEACQVLSLAEVIEVNRRMISVFGGIFFDGDSNQRNPGSLQHLIEAIQFPLFGYDAYPSVAEKAAALAWRIITTHVFHDGNKRTAMEACRLLLAINGYDMRVDDDTISMALHIAKHQVDFQTFVQWVEQRTVRIRQ